MLRCSVFDAVWLYEITRAWGFHFAHLGQRWRTVYSSRRAVVFLSLWQHHGHSTVVLRTQFLLATVALKREVLLWCLAWLNSGDNIGASVWVSSQCSSHCGLTLGQRGELYIGRWYEVVVESVSNKNPRTNIKIRVCYDFQSI
jgi:hypothetical protein